LLKTSVTDIMTEHVVKITEDASVMQAAHILLRFRINGVFIVKKEDNNKIIGIITTTDLLKLFDEALSGQSHRLAELDKISGMSVIDIASKNITSVQKDAKVAKIIAIMHRKNIHTIPIYDGEKLVGVIGRHDLLNVAFQSKKS